MRIMDEPLDFYVYKDGTTSLDEEYQYTVEEQISDFETILADLRLDLFDALPGDAEEIQESIEFFESILKSVKNKNEKSIK